MEFNDLLRKNAITESEVLVVRHRPRETSLRKILPWLAAKRPEVYNAYQQCQFPKVEKMFTRARYIASFIGVDAGTALFAGLYTNNGSKKITAIQFGALPAGVALINEYGMEGLGRVSALWFDLILRPDFYPTWRGRLVVNWPGPELSWCRWADRNAFTIDTILPSVAFDPPMTEWSSLIISWPELQLLPQTWENSLREWKGIYYILDKTDGKGYVGAAYGKENILGRWRNYRDSGHGGNKQLRKRDAKNFLFSILERVSLDMKHEDVIRIEQSWKTRLHTRRHGLNEN